MHRLTSLFVAAILTAGGAAIADSRGNAREAAHDAHEKRVDRRETRDDALDLKRLQALLDRFTAARARRDRRALAAIDVQLTALARREAREDRAELAKDRAEQRQAHRELRRSRREVRRDGRRYDDRHDRRGDRRDLRGDRRDTAVESATLAKRRAIARRLLALAGKQDPASLDRKRAALADLIALARLELRQDASERREDRRERREDRRERREDRR